MTTDDEYEIDRRGGRWDGVWRGRGRSSSQRRNLANAALEAARVAALMAEGARLIDTVRGPDRDVAIHAVRAEIRALRGLIQAYEDHLGAEAGLPEPPPEMLRRSWWRRVLRAARNWIDRKAMGAP